MEIEFIKHLFGICGEGHVNILSLLVFTPIVFLYGWIRMFISLLGITVKSVLKRFE